MCMDGEMCLNYVILKGLIRCDNIKVELNERYENQCQSSTVQSSLPSCLITPRHINIYAVCFAVHPYIVIANTESFCSHDKYCCHQLAKFCQVVSVFPCQTKCLRQRNGVCSKHLLKKQIRLSVWHTIVGSVSYTKTSRIELKEADSSCCNKFVLLLQ